MTDEDIQIVEELDDKGNKSGVEEDNIDTSEIAPFDPDKIRLRTQPFSLAQCLGRIKQGSLLLSPDFQRAFVWDKKRQSQLIESLMLKIPLPMFYVSADAKENYHVVDGLQRLTTLRNFVLSPEERTDHKDERFKLEGLEFWKELEGKHFDELDIYLQNRILETTLQVTIIEYNTPEKVKRNVFKRLNTGGMPLTSQEIRNALYQGKSTILLKELVQENAFIRATNHSIGDGRMVGREIILRFIAFNLFASEYKVGDMDEFLSNSMEKINLFTNEQIDNIRDIFLLAMKRSYELFGDHSFRKSLPIDYRKSPINKSLFEVWSVLLANMDNNKYLELKTRSDLLFKNLQTLYSEDSFQRAVSRDSWKVESVRTRYNFLSKIIDMTLQGERYETFNIKF